MATTSPSDLLLAKLSAELRVQIYHYILMTSKPLRRPLLSDASITSLLLVNHQICNEAIDVLYSNNAFKLSLQEVATYPNRTNFSEMRHIFLAHPIGDGEYGFKEGEGGLCTHACRFIAATKQMPLPLHLCEVVIEVGHLSSAYHAELVSTTIGGRVRDVDVGVWEVEFGQGFRMVVRYERLCRVWSRIWGDAVGRDFAIRMATEDRFDYDYGCLTRADMLCALVYCAVGDSGFSDVELSAFFEDAGLALWSYSGVTFADIEGTTDTVFGEGFDFGKVAPGKRRECGRANRILLAVLEAVTLRNDET
ncbi:hypothetical protein BAUCODRAFT_148535 [Baudoinia panamericana UAMH 10762]|uniref:Uncharacterized protein n=1 Tax=Baudoinia panamericana (strain UAMH 10762) TaxID=717646 RepID=M2MG92_BAUPA|nr:uncharacterized protein BAUCODRAFT_148535 [Baudoinia panamericana UAMH 10762]EMC95646.1 hypothetical protein BAUCODRAFT_148535 [Baudoinia panamericana UAMH 10762]